MVLVVEAMVVLVQAPHLKMVMLIQAVVQVVMVRIIVSMLEKMEEVVL